MRSEKIPAHESSEVKSEKVELSGDEKLAIFGLEAPIKEILAQLKEEIDHGDYGVIIGDDATGRIPTLMIARIIKTLYEKKNLPPPLIRFIAGSSNLSNYSREKNNKQEAVNRQMERIKKDLTDASTSGHKVLIVTDTIAFGRSVGVLIGAMKENNMEVDVATIAMVSSRGTEPFEDRWKAKVAVGSNKGSPELYHLINRHLMSGVRKSAENLFAEPAVKLPEYYEKLNPNQQEFEDKNSERSQQLTNKARGLAFEIADRIAEKYEKQK